MSDTYTGKVRKLAPIEQEKIEAKYPMMMLGDRPCQMKTSPSWLTRHCWTCTRPAQHDGPHVAHRDSKPVAIWGSPRPGEHPKWLITRAVGLPLIEEIVHRR